jgi:hypothetical protein
MGLRATTKDNAETQSTQRFAENDFSRDLIDPLQRTLGDGGFFVGAEDLAQGVADFAEGGVGFYGGVDGGH